jgi:predicted GIY-YIG superfamily endonuclease
MIHRAEADEVALYRLFAGDGSLLYVGISKDPLERWREHLGSHSWWRQVAEYELCWYPTRAEAREAEKAAMLSEGPRHNIHSAPRHSAHWKAVLNTPAVRAARAKRPKKDDATEA